MSLLQILRTLSIRRYPTVQFARFIRFKHSSWTNEEDQSLKQFVNENGNKWSVYVAHYAPHRLPQDCRYRYTDISSPAVKKGPFDASEIEKLRQGVREFGEGNWKAIQQKYLPDRPNRKIANVWSLQANPNLVTGSWTDKEDQLLRNGVAKYGHEWSKISKEFLPHRSRQSLRYRYCDTLNLDIKHGKWSQDELSLLLQRVIMFGTNNWKKVADGIHGRTATMCQQTWYLKVDPSLNKRDWDDTEIRIFWKLVENRGKKWTTIATQLPGRSSHDCFLIFWTTVRQELGMLIGTSSKLSFSNDWVKQFAKDMSQSLDTSKRIIRASDGHTQEIDIGKWSDNDIANLVQLVDEHSLSNGTVDWESVAAKFPNRTKEQCRNEFRYHEKHRQETPLFSQEEDDNLVTLVHKHQTRWNLIAQELPGRTTDECKLRWNKHTKWKQDDNRRRPRLTDDEKDLIREGVSMFGNSWIAISNTYLPHISPQRCMNWWHSVGKYQDSVYSKDDIDRFLKIAVKVQGTEDTDKIDWKAVAQLVPTLSPNRCKERWQSWKTETQPWTDAEEIALIEAVHKCRGNPQYRNRMWAAIAEEVGNNRTPKQCASKLKNIRMRRALSDRFS
ncbi:hypothetical protein BGW37DRAFT_463125 [Umbelopsis sp. PMI_123]|nr:hypothetical protein BGW37DRAFT_463125 [Umbelopsis sp. PMI_123]